MAKKKEKKTKPADPVPLWTLPMPIKMAKFLSVFSVVCGVLAFLTFFQGMLYVISPIFIVGGVVPGTLALLKLEQEKNEKHWEFAVIGFLLSSLATAIIAIGHFMTLFW